MDRNEVIVREAGRIADIPKLRADLHLLETKIKEIPGHIEALDVMHHFTDGIYMRTVLMKKGDIVVGKIHKKEHLVIVSAGRAKIVSEEAGAREIVAPFIFKSQPNVKRGLLIIEDMIFTTVHPNPTNTQDLAVLEDELISKDYDGVES